MKLFKSYIIEEGIEPIKPVVLIQPELPRRRSQQQQKETPRTGDVYTGSLYRLDTQPLSPETRAFDFDSEYNSGTAGAFKNQKNITQRKGLFAGRIHEVAPYAAGRSTPFIFRMEQGKSRGIVYFENRHRDMISSQRPTLSAFSSKGFVQIPSGEHFMETDRTPTPEGSKVIDDPLKFISQHHDIKFVDDLKPLARKFNAESNPNISTTINGVDI